MLGLLPAQGQPRSEIVGPKLAAMDKCIAQLDTVAAKLVRFDRTWPRHMYDALTAKVATAREHRA